MSLETSTFQSWYHKNGARGKLSSAQKKAHHQKIYEILQNTFKAVLFS